MSVLTNMIQSRADWATKHQAIEARHRFLKCLAECVLLVLLGIIVYQYHERIVALLTAWFRV